MNISRLTANGIKFIHGDIRNLEDLSICPEFEILIECSAEPSVQAGYGSDPSYLINTNLIGALNCLELCRKRNASILFISTSRVYPIEPLRKIPLEVTANRMDIPKNAQGNGWSEKGITEEFPLSGFRSLYGSTKLSAELFIQEYSATYGIRSIINRCGVLSGPWQMGKVDQGFISLWAGRYTFGGDLAYIGFNGLGQQIRDILHIDDFCELLEEQILNLNDYNGTTFNVGGGAKNSISLLELSMLCEKITGRKKSIRSVPGTHPADIPYYVTDNNFVTQQTGWSPRKNLENILSEIFKWLESTPGLKNVFLA